MEGASIGLQLHIQALQLRHGHAIDGPTWVPRGKGGGKEAGNLERLVHGKGEHEKYVPSGIWTNYE